MDQTQSIHRIYGEPRVCIDESFGSRIQLHYTTGMEQYYSKKPKISYGVKLTLSNAFVVSQFISPMSYNWGEKVILVGLSERLERS